MASFFTQVLRFRLLIVAAALGVLALGILQLRNSPVDVLPEFTPPYAEIQTEALGLSAEEVEQLITVPLEADLLNGVEGVEVIRSDSVPGLSSIVMVFAKGTDIYEARLLVQERLTQAHALPTSPSHRPCCRRSRRHNRVLMIGLPSTELSPIEQSVLARWTVRPQLMGVPGVANVSIWGLRDQQLQVQVDPATLAGRKVTLNQIIRTTGNAQVVSPLSFLEASTPGTGGFIESPQQRLQVRHLLERIADPGELAKVPVEGTNGAAAAGRRVHHRGGPPAADRRCRRQRRAWPAAGRREVPRREHARGYRGRRECAGDAAARIDRNEHGYVRFPPRRLHFRRARQYRSGFTHRRHLDARSHCSRCGCNGGQSWSPSSPCRCRSSPPR